jgi:octaprenyl-diphosphate synthase
LDIVQDEKILGKPNMHDFKEGKTTLPYIYLFKKLNENDKEKLKSLFKKDLSEDKKNWIKQKMQENKIIEICLNEAQNLVNEAKKAIEKYGIKELETIADKIVNRSK